MSVWRDLFEGLTCGFLESGGLQRLRNNGVCYQERGRIERLTRENGWSIDGRTDDTIYLDFKSPFASDRRLLISRGDEALVIFSGMSFAEVPAHNFPQEVLGYLLERNAEMALGAWNMQITEEGKALCFCRYVAIGMGLNAGLFKYVCEGLNEEVHEFDVRMQKAGLL